MRITIAISLLVAINGNSVPPTEGSSYMSYHPLGEQVASPIIFQTFMQLADEQQGLTGSQNYLHDGLDITTASLLSSNSEVGIYAAEDATMYYYYLSDNDPANTIILVTDDDIDIVYGHVYVPHNFGDPIGEPYEVGNVNAGDDIGKIENSGEFANFHCCHLHFEMNDKGTQNKINPLLHDSDIFGVDTDTPADFNDTYDEGYVDYNDGYMIFVDDQPMYSSSAINCAPCRYETRDHYLRTINEITFDEEYTNYSSGTDHIYTSSSSANIFDCMTSDGRLASLISTPQHNTYLYLPNEDQGELSIAVYDADGHEWIANWDPDVEDRIPFTVRLNGDPRKGKLKLEIVENDYFDDGVKMSLFSGRKEDMVLLSQKPLELERKKKKLTIKDLDKEEEYTDYYSLIVEAPDGNYVFEINKEEGWCECIDFYK